MDVEDLKDLVYSKKRKKRQALLISNDVIEQNDTTSEIEEKSSKKSRSDDEIISMRGAETLYSSNLLKLQIEELLKQLRQPKVVDLEIKLEKFLKKLRGRLSSLPLSSPKTLDEHISNLQVTKDNQDGIQLPFDLTQLPFVTDSSIATFQLMAPKIIKVIGSYLTDFQMKSNMCVDIAVEVPTDCLHPRDYLNYKYVIKISLYLAFLVKYLARWKSIKSISYFYFNDNRLKPAIKIIPSNLKPVQIHIVPFITSENLFKLTKLLPYNNCIRVTSPEGPPGCSLPTPFYNNSLLSCLFYKQHTEAIQLALNDCPGIKDAMLLIKVWLQQRGLSTGYGAFTGFLSTMLLVYLTLNRRINNIMSEFQIFRVFIQFISHSSWNEEPITLCTTENENIPKSDSFLPFFPVAFIDNSGYLNLLGDMSLTQYLNLKHEAQLTFKLLDSQNEFQSIFLMKLTFVDKYDCTIIITKYGNIVNRKLIPEELPDTTYRIDSECERHLTKMLARGLNDRITLIATTPTQIDPWDIHSAPPAVSDLNSLTIGLLLNDRVAYRISDVGPSVEQTQSKEFYSLWGEKAETRRFPDGTVCPVVQWADASSESQIRNIPYFIVKHLTATHFKCSSNNIYFNGLHMEKLLNATWYDSAQNSTGENVTNKIKQAFNDLTQLLYSFTNLPLRITSVQGTHPIFRNTESIPPPTCPSSSKLMRSFISSDDDYLTPDPEMATPRYSPALTAVIQMSTSGKWPDKLEAVWRIKTAFLVELSKQLTTQKIVSLATYNFLDVYYEGYIFRLQLCYNKELGYLETAEGPPEEVLRLKNHATFLAYELKLLPAYTGTINSLTLDYPSLSETIRISKRWVHAMMLSFHISEIAVELLVLNVYLKIAPFNKPMHYSVAFLRFLKFISKNDWQTQPVIINVHSKLTNEEISNIEENFLKCRGSLPPLFIASPWDRNSRITRQKPTLPVLHRLSLLAHQSYETLSEILKPSVCLASFSDDIKKIFRPPLEDYDVIIKIKLNYVSRAVYAVDPVVTALPDTTTFEKESVIHSVMPVVDFDPVEMFVSELNSRYDQIALFFHDKYGGREVGIVWKPVLRDNVGTTQFKVNNCGGRKLDKSSRLIKTDFNSIISDIEILGADIIEQIINNISN